RNMPIAKKQRRPDVSSRKTKRCAEYSAHLCLCMSSSPIWKLRHGRRPERQKEKGSAPKTPNGGAALRPGLQAERNVLHSGRKERRKKAASRRWARRFPSQGPVGTALHESYFTRRSNPHFCSLYCSVCRGIPNRRAACRTFPPQAANASRIIRSSTSANTS